MRDGDRQTREPAAAGDIYRKLLESTPRDRTETVLRLLREHPQGRLELPAHEGRSANLNEIDLSGAGLTALHTPDTLPAWDAGLQTISLRGADLRGASLRTANLQGVLLEEANLSGADLAGANLRGALLAGANFQEAMLEETDLSGSALRFAYCRHTVFEGAKLRRADLWGAKCEGAILTNADLHGATLTEADFRGADLRGANLREAILKQTNLEGANLEGADLRGAVFGGTNLRGAILRGAKLQGVVLIHSHLENVHVCDAWLERTHLLREQVGNAIGEERAEEYELARRGYLALERNFDQLGDPDSASWAYGKKRRMQKRGALKAARAARAEGRWRPALAAYLRFTREQLVEWICDYGESVPRVLCSLLFVYVFFALLYGVTGSIDRLEGPRGAETRTVTRRPVDLAVFSLLALTTSGTPAVGLLPRNEAVHLLTGIQALLGISLTGLLGFVAGHRLRR